MNYHNQIHFWAHMLDESFTNHFDEKLPKDENEKFKFGEVFTTDVFSKYDSDETFNDFLCKIWPKWEEYFQMAISENIEVEGAQIDVDDWDKWTISIEDLNGGYDQCLSILFEKFGNGSIKDDYICSLKDIIDMCVEELADTEYDMSTLEKYGELIYKGHYRTGGYYPDH